MLARVIGLWWPHACRIVYVFDESEPTRRFGLPMEPCLNIPGQAKNDSRLNGVANDVHYDILAFSRVKHGLTRLGYPVVQQFGLKSAAAVRRAVH